jgi:hypothetical protein
MEYPVGPVFIRNCFASRGHRIPGHAHNFSHVTFATEGWLLIRKEHKVIQLVSHDYARVRELLYKTDPSKVLRPVRFPDVAENHQPRFNIEFIGIQDEVPAGAKEILVQPAYPHGHWALIDANIQHEIFVLSDRGAIDCVFPHRGYDGAVLEEYGGFRDSYY